MNIQRVVCWLIVVVLCPFAQAVDSRIEVMAGLTLSEFADVPNARQMAQTQSGDIVVGSRKLGKVHGISEQGEVFVLADELFMPSAVAIDSQNRLYIAAVNSIYRVDNLDRIFEQRKPVSRLNVLADGLPDASHHGWKAITLSPDESTLVVPVGAPCNICLVHPESGQQPFGTILAINKSKLDQGQLAYDLMATGVRNSVGMDFHPKTGDLWFSDNGRDWMGDDMPPCEINRIPQSALTKGNHYGYPFIHGHPQKGGALEPQDDIRARMPDKQFINPLVEIQAHSAPLGIHWYRGSGEQAMDALKGALLVAEHGSWNRSSPVGYRVSAYWFDRNHEVTEHKVLVDFLTDNDDKLGRPVDFLELANGDVLISDDAGNKIWRLSAATADKQ
ncbi:sorbosone dehydrogenase family protein [Bermanella marisrubri]|uniref:L-sorbosone dehydrogenase, putative n=1 Tax=Bermanella marisrubri TaxID=207949 RepID=Q1MYU3_9GAMM|nr:PQQ-dependent sugar dehydrogenase [Bermanella marisrubri]EAT11113.1 L-sorbosone dehydrogenase, putative [Oceanobacter sp. RED65] [Bermanella marisrubri]QIZ83441.1 sorbosone dehydrogenase family protein [Bermanella marisrubri]